MLLTLHPAQTKGEFAAWPEDSDLQRSRPTSMRRSCPGSVGCLENVVMLLQFGEMAIVLIADGLMLTIAPDRRTEQGGKRAAVGAAMIASALLLMVIFFPKFER
jgi:hypothetical protein